MNEELKKVVDIIVRDFAPDKIILFGSRARGDFKKNSDYDLMVLKTDVPHRRKMAQDIEMHLYPLPTPTDIIVETPAHYEELTHNKFMIYKEIKKEGKVIYEK